MRKLCKKCGNAIPTRAKIDDVWKNVQNRTECLTCLPFKTKKPKKGSQDRHKTPEMRKYYVDYVRNRRREFKKKAVEFLGGCCSVCGYSRCLEAIDIHHKNDKKFQISAVSYRMSWLAVEEELKKCVALCANCHRELHATEPQFAS